MTHRPLLGHLVVAAVALVASAAAAAAAAAAADVQIVMGVAVGADAFAAGFGSDAKCDMYLASVAVIWPCCWCCCCCCCCCQSYCLCSVAGGTGKRWQ